MEDNMSSVLCSAHGEKLQLFCLDDQRLACSACLHAEKHAGHEFLPADEASGRYKQKVRESLEPLKGKLKVFEEVKDDYDRTENHIQVQARNAETQIKEQFENLRRFLQEEEEARMAALREEEAQKSRQMKERVEGLSREMVSLFNAIQAAEDQLRVDDHVSFLQSYRTTMEGVQLARAQDPPPPLSGALMDEAKHLGNLTFRVWNKMKDIVSYTPVILDPNTAHPCLKLSGDLTGVSRVWAQRLPHNAERYDFWARVLASEGFSSGRHSWDVEVGDSRGWEIGVCEESQKRKGYVSGGHWLSDDYRAAVSSSPGPGTVQTVLLLKQRPRRIRVQLDWDRGQLSFSDPDTDARLHTFTHTFTGRLFPFVTNGPSLKMLPGKICVTLENHS